MEQETAGVSKDVAPPTERELDIVKSCTAYSDLSYATLANKFNIPCGLLGRPVENEVLSLIINGLLACHRIDAASQRVISLQRPAWESIRGEALLTAAEIEHNFSLRLHAVNARLSCVEIKGGKALMSKLGRAANLSDQEAL